MIQIYTDGSAIQNPGPGGYAAVLMSDGNRKEISQGYTHTTNNRMELMAVAAALQALINQDKPVIIHTDSNYVGEPFIKGYIIRWERKGWMLTQFKPVKNVDIWKRIVLLIRARKAPVTFKIVKGHSDNAWNNRCDTLAGDAARSTNKISDHGYEQILKTASGLSKGCSIPMSLIFSSLAWLCVFFVQEIGSVSTYLSFLASYYQG